MGKMGKEPTGRATHLFCGRTEYELLLTMVRRLLAEAMAAKGMMEMIQQERSKVRMSKGLVVLSLEAMDGWGVWEEQMVEAWEEAVGEGMVEVWEGGTVEDGEARGEGWEGVVEEVGEERMEVGMEEEIEEGTWQLPHGTRVPYGKPLQRAFQAPTTCTWQLPHGTRFPYTEPLDRALEAATTDLPLYALHEALRRQISNIQLTLISIGRTTRWVVISRHQNRTLSHIWARCSRSWM